MVESAEKGVAEELDGMLKLFVKRNKDLNFTIYS